MSQVTTRGSSTLSDPPAAAAAAASTLLDLWRRRMRSSADLPAVVVRMTFDRSLYLYPAQADQTAAGTFTVQDSVASVPSKRRL